MKILKINFFRQFGRLKYEFIQFNEKKLDKKSFLIFKFSKPICRWIFQFIFTGGKWKWKIFILNKNDGFYYYTFLYIKKKAPNILHNFTNAIINVKRMRCHSIESRFGIWYINDVYTNSFKHYKMLTDWWLAKPDRYIYI